MSDQTGSYPPDEPVIGANYPGTGVAHGDAATVDDGDSDDYASPYDEDEYYDDRYYESEPGRQPLFYAFIAVAALVGVAVVFLLYNFISKGDSTNAAQPDSVQFRVRLDAPQNDEHMEIGKEKPVQVTASSNEQITKFQLFIDDKPDTEVAVTEEPPDRIYTQQLKLSLPKKGDYTLFVRVTSQSKASRDSTKIHVVAVEPFSEQAVSVAGKVQTTTSARRQPRDDGDEVRRLNPGDQVKIIARTQGTDWLMIEGANSSDILWVKAAAIQTQGPLTDLPVRDAPPPTTVPATNTATVPAQPSPSPASPYAGPSPSPVASTIDFVPTGASLVENGRKLRITVSNLGSSNYSGPLVVSVTGVGDQQRTVFSVNISPNGATAVDFQLADAVTTLVTAQVRVDPDNAIRETNEDNNVATFGLTPPIEPPGLAITGVDIRGVEVAITITNSGGELKATDVTVRLTFPGGGSTTSLTQTQNSRPGAKGQSTVIRMTKPNPSGPASAQLFINGQPQTTAFNFTLP